MALALETQILDLRSEFKIQEVSVFAKGVGASLSVELDPDRVFHAASTMKVAVMMEAFRQARSDSLLLDEPIEVINLFESAVSAPDFGLDPSEDSDPGLYTSIGSTVTVMHLVERMIVRSSNLATNLLVNRLRVSEIQKLTVELGALDLKVRRGVEDSAAFRQGVVNTTSARSLAQLFLEIVGGEYFSRSESEAMLNILSRQEFRHGIPRGVPEATRVCNKTGWLPGFFHDAGFVELKGQRGFVLVVLTRAENQELAFEFISRVGSLCSAGLN